MNDFFDQLIRGAMYRLDSKQLETTQVDSYPEIIIESDNIENSCGGTCIVKDAYGKIWILETLKLHTIGCFRKRKKSLDIEIFSNSISQAS